MNYFLYIHFTISINLHIYLVSKLNVKSAHPILNVWGWGRVLDEDLHCCILVSFVRIIFMYSMLEHFVHGDVLFGAVFGFGSCLALYFSHKISHNTWPSMKVIHPHSNQAQLSFQSRLTGLGYHFMRQSFCGSISRGHHIKNPVIIFFNAVKTTSLHQAEKAAISHLVSAAMLAIMLFEMSTSSCYNISFITFILDIPIKLVFESRTFVGKLFFSFSVY